MTHPTPKELFEPAHLLSSRIIRHLWDNWGTDDGGIRNNEVDLYNVNIPMVPQLLHADGLDIYWTKIWRNSYGRLFKAHATTKPAGSPAGPDSLNDPPVELTENGKQNAEDAEKLVFKFAPDMGHLINPDLSSVPPGTDGWAVSNGWASVTPLRASFAEPTGVVEQQETTQQVNQRLWKMKL